MSSEEKKTVVTLGKDVPIEPPPANLLRPTLPQSENPLRNPVIEKIPPQVGESRSENIPTQIRPIQVMLLLWRNGSLIREIAITINPGTHFDMLPGDWWEVRG